MAPKKIRAGVVGCGKISHFHIHNINKNKQADVVGLCDPYQPSIDKLAEGFVAAGTWRQTPSTRHHQYGIPS